jgi:teichuronic acid biosynthesis glycosyltransferase TuaH
MKRLPTWGMRPIGRTVTDWRSCHAGGAPLALVMTYPYYLFLGQQVRPEVQVYFNLDDYALYWPKCADEVRRLEHRAVRESDLTVCVSRLRAEELRRAVPEAADRVRHLPHGAPSSFLADAPQHRPAPPPDDLASLPRPLLGYIGSMEDRVDWGLLTRLSEAFPSASVVLIGRPAPEQDADWYSEYRGCLARPNVHALGWRPQEMVGRYNAAFDVCLIPYRADHPFNRACCPTKIMDTMGSGRPMVSTALPECLLYEHLFDVAAGDDAFLAAVGRILAAGSDDGRASDRHEWARAHTCERVAERFLDWIMPS